MRKGDRIVVLDKETAGDIMDVHFIVVDEQAALPTVAKKVQGHLRRTNQTPSILVLNRKKHLLGHALIADLIRASPDTRIGTLVRPIHTVQDHLPRHELLHFAANAHADRIVVLDTKQKPVGIVQAKDLLHKLAEERSLSLSHFAGVQKDESPMDSPFMVVRRRNSWLLVNYFTALLAAYTVSLFEDTLSKMIILAVYMPVVAGMGGNAATQAIAVTVRGIALKQIPPHKGWVVVGKEIVAGLLNGLIIGAFAAALAILLKEPPAVGLVLGLALIINHIVAGLFGSLIPLVLKRFGFDPALSASIFVTTATDVLGFLAFLGLATIMLF